MKNNNQSFFNKDSFFETPNYIKYAQTLSNYKDLNVEYNPADAAHNDLIVNLANATSAAENKLLKIDYKIGMGLVLGLSAFMFSAILPVGLLAMGGFVFAAYQYGLRKQAENEQQSASKTLLACANWSLGDISDKKIEDIRKSPQIKQMIKVLAPICSQQQIADAIDDRYEGGFITEAQAINAAKKEPLFGTEHVLTKDESALFYGIYGIGQGGALDILGGLYYLLKKFSNTATDFVKVHMNSVPAVAPSK